jgi:membrane protein
MKRRLTLALGVVKDAGEGWLTDNASRLGAALSYYTVFSIGPLILIAVAVAGLFFGRDAAQKQIYDTLSHFVGTSGASAVAEVVKSAAQPSKSVIATLIGIVTLIVGATGVFGELHSALNLIWKVEPKPGRGLWAFFRERFLSFAMVMGTGFLLLVSLLMTAALSALGSWLTDSLPGGAALWQIINFFIALAVVSGIFGLLFALVPDVRVPWKCVWPAAFVTGLLFSLGKFALGFYIGKANIASSYGAAGSLIVVVVWVYYSAQILYFGAELVRAHVAERHVEVQPKSIAQPIQPKPSPAGTVIAPT